jgi:hypothetical protein
MCSPWEYKIQFQTLPNTWEFRYGEFNITICISHRISFCDTVGGAYELAYIKELILAKKYYHMNKTAALSRLMRSP